MDYLIAGGVLVLLLTLAGIGWIIRQRNMQYWLPEHCFPTERKPSLARVEREQGLKIFLAVCDHYEPEWGRPGLGVSLAKVDRWVEEYPRLFGGFRDSAGRPPQHTFFYPQDEYRPEYLDRLAQLCAAGFGEVEVHLHHDGDTAESLREKLAEFRDTLYHRHGLLRRDPRTGEIVYGFIHGNWALCHSRPDGRWCGVPEEIDVLRETGCYADFTLPSAPSDTQTRTINSIYYAVNQPGRVKSHDRGQRATVGQAPPEQGLLMIQGPLLPDWGRRKFGLIPRIENGDLQASLPPAFRRLSLWKQAHVHVAGRPDWVFIKLHTHGCKDGNIDTLLGTAYQQFHQELGDFLTSHPRNSLYYVTAWELAQLVHAAEQQRDLSTVLNHSTRTAHAVRPPLFLHQ